MFLTYGKRLIHNTVLYYDDSERIARAIVVLSSSGQQEYLTRVRDFLVHLFLELGNSNECNIFQEAPTLEEQLSVFRRLAGVDMRKDVHLVLSLQRDSIPLPLPLEAALSVGDEPMALDKLELPRDVSFWRWLRIVAVMRPGLVSFEGTVRYPHDKFAHALTLFGFESVPPVCDLQRDCERLVQLNIDVCFADAAAEVPHLAAHFAAAGSHQLGRTLQELLAGLAGAAVALDQAAPPAVMPEGLTDTKAAELNKAEAWTAATVLGLFDDVRADVTDDPFAFDGLLLDAIWNAFLARDAAPSDESERFRGWFLREGSLLVDEAWLLLATEREHHFANVVRLLDPYRPDGWQVAAHFFRGLKAAVAVPTRQDVQAFCERLFDERDSLLAKLMLPHRIEGDRLFHPSATQSWLRGLAHWIWHGAVVGHPPLLLALLRFIGFLARFGFVDRMVGLAWRLRARFATAPAALATVLSCCSLRQGTRPLLQGTRLLLQGTEPPLPGLAFAAEFADEFADFTIPAIVNGETAYEQICGVMDAFVPEYKIGRAHV
jgi:hypothetical protein